MDEIKKTISIDVSQAEQSLKDYKNSIDELSKSLDGLDKSSEAYASISGEVAKAQKPLNDAIGAGSKNATSGASTMGSLNKALASNVPTIGKVNTAFKVLSKNTVFAIIGAAVLVFGALTKAIKGSEEQTQAIQKVFAAFEPILNAVSNAISALAGAVIAFAERAVSAIQNVLGWLSKMLKFVGLDKWADKLQGGLDKMEESIDLRERENELIREKRENLMKEADINLEISELREKISDKENLSIEERRKALDEWAEKEKELADMKYQEALKEYELCVERNALTESSTEDLQKQADLYVKMQNALKGLNDVERTINKTRISLNKEEETAQAERNRAAKAAADARKKEAEQRAKEIERLKQQELDKIKEIEDKIAESQSTEIENLERVYNERVALYEKHGKDITALTEQFERDKINIITKANKEEQDLRKQWLSEQFKELEDAAKQEQFELSLVDLDTEGLKIEEALALEQEAAQAKYDIEQQLIMDKIALQELYLENFVGSTEEMAIAEAELDNLRQQYANKKKKYDKETADTAKKYAQKELADKRAAQNQLLSNTASLFGTLSGMMDENSEEAKALAVMETIINTLQAIMGTWAGYSSMGPWGVAAAAVQTAAITATGAATVSQIMSTNKNSKGVPTVATPSIPEQSMTEVTPLLDEQSDINRLTSLTEQGDSSNETQNLRVYVVDQDIIDATNRVKVVESNATF